MPLITAPTTGKYQLAPITVPVVPLDPPAILALQAAPSAPTSQTIVTGTNLLNLPPNMMARLRSFPEEVYSLNPTDHLVKLLYVLLGDAGAGQLRKTMLKARLGTVIQGSNFYELDSFYGALFGVVRNSTEQLAVNPYTDVADATTWATIRAQDALYRTRLDQFGKAVSLGPSAIGMELMAGAILQTPCDIYESWKVIDEGVGLWSYLEVGTWGDLESSTWGELEEDLPPYYNTNRKVFTVVPHRAITLEESFNLRQVLNVMKPADSILLIDNAGLDVRQQVTLRGVSADSTYWELQKFIIPNPQYASLYNLSPDVQPGGWRELLKAAFTQYEGEQISYGGDITGVSGYDLNTATPPVVIVPTVIDAYTFFDGVTLFYPPSQAIATRFFSAAGRFVSDAINQGAIYSNDQSNTPISTSGPVDVPLMDLYIDGMSIDDLTAALDAPGIIQNLGIQSSSQRFWSTPPRPNTDDTVEVLDVYLIAERLVNTISFAAAHYPQVINVLTYDSTNATWNSVFSQKILDSVPSVLPTATPSVHEHPQHPESNWDTFTISIPPTLMTQIRITLQRISQGTPPVTATVSTSILTGYPQVLTFPVPYSLGIQDFALGYQVAQQGDLPNQPIITTDVLGSQIEYLERLEVANGTIDDSGIPWRCEPQPTADSVVNFYLDTRDNTGKAQLIDSLFMDPLYLGPHCTIYYSSDNTSVIDFPSEDTPLASPVFVITGNANVVPGVGGWFFFDTSNPSYVTIDNTDIQWDPSEAWWMGVTIQPQFPSTAVPGDSVAVLDFEGIILALGSNEVVLEAVSGDTLDGIVTYDFSWAAGQLLDFVISYSPITGVAFYLNGTEIGTIALDDVPADYFPASLRFGNLLPPFSLLSSPAAFNILGFVLKQASIGVNDVANFTTTITPYTTVGGAKTDNAILYFNASNVSSSNQYGWVGGPGDFWSLLNWTPVVRDFILSRGFMELPPTWASFFKLEFTNLVAEPFSTLLPITRTAKTHQGIGPSVVQEPYQPPQNSPGPTVPGTSSAVEIAPYLNFTDNPNAQGTTTPAQPTTANLPTMAQTAPDISTQTVLANAAWYYQYQEWAPPQTAPRFVNTSVHMYSTTEVNQNTQVSYFVGLSSISAWRSNFTGESDQRMYDEAFIDDGFINIHDIPQTPGDVNTYGYGGSFPISDESAIYNSITPVQGVQFATVQSDAIQIAHNDDFSDPAIQPPYAWNLTTQPHLVGDAVAYYQPNQTVLVVRNTVSPPPALPGWDGIVDPIVYPIFEEEKRVVEYIGLTAEVGTFGSQPGSVSPGYLGSPPAFGGLAGAYADTADGGTVYAAVRVSTNDVLASPLALEIYDVDSSTIVASLPVAVAPNQTVEVYVGYVLGSTVPAGGPMCARIVQYGGANNSWVVDRLSLFQDAWQWEFSNDGGSTWMTELNTRNNAFGIITFPGAGAELRWRVTAWATNLHLHYLRVRPVYTDLTSDEPNGVIQGPNLSPYDHTPPIDEDPFFAGWSKPIPYSWFAASGEYTVLPGS